MTKEKGSKKIKNNIKIGNNIQKIDFVIYILSK